MHRAWQRVVLELLRSKSLATLAVNRMVRMIKGNRVENEFIDGTGRKIKTLVHPRRHDENRFPFRAGETSDEPACASARSLAQESNVERFQELRVFYEDVFDGTATADEQDGFASDIFHP